MVSAPKRFLTRPWGHDYAMTWWYAFAMTMDRRTFLRGAGGGAALGIGATLLGSCTNSSNLTGHGASTAKYQNPPGAGIGKGTPIRGGQITMSTGSEINGFDPSMSSWDATGLQYAGTVYDQLAALAPDGSVHPYLAESITPNADYDVWTIQMRPNVMFHNGKALDADAVKTNLDAFVASAAHRGRVQQRREDDGDRSSHRASSDQDTVGRVSLLPHLSGRHDRRAKYPRQDGSRPSDRNRPLHLRRLGAERPFHRQTQPQLLASEPPVPRHDRVHAVDRPGFARGRVAIWLHRHNAVQLHAEPRRPVGPVRVHGHKRPLLDVRARHGLRHAEPGRASLQRHEGSPGARVRREPRGDRARSSGTGSPRWRQARSFPGRPDYGRRDTRSSIFKRRSSS